MQMPCNKTFFFYIFFLGYVRSSVGCCLVFFFTKAGMTAGSVEDVLWHRFTLIKKDKET